MSRLSNLGFSVGNRGEKSFRTFVSWVVGSATVAVLVYSFSVLSLVSLSGDIGLRFVLGTMVRDRIDTGDYDWNPAMPELGSNIIQLGSSPIRNYPDLVQALRDLQVGEKLDVVWVDPQEVTKQSNVLVRRRPFWTYASSIVWFVQEIFIFVIGARVFWKRPRDPSAAIFFLICVLTFGALYGWISLDGNCDFASVDPRIHSVRRFSAVGQPPFLPGFSNRNADLHKIQALDQSTDLCSSDDLFPAACRQHGLVALLTIFGVGAGFASGCLASLAGIILRWAIGFDLWTLRDLSLCGLQAGFHRESEGADSVDFAGLDSLLAADSLCALSSGSGFQHSRPGRCGGMAYVCSITIVYNSLCL